MGYPRRAGVLNRMFGYARIPSVCVAGVWLAGCASCPVTDAPPAAPAEACAAPPAAVPEEARLAGAEALCAQALNLMGAQDVADTNALNQAIYDSLRWACQLVPDNTNILETAMFYLVDRALFNEAYAVAQEHLARDPENHALRYAAACCADAAGKPEVAAEQCARIYAAQPDNRALEETLARLYFLSGQDARAFEVMRAAAARNPDAASRGLPVKWAVFFASQEKDFARALACAAFALEFWELPVERSPILALMGECHLRAEQFEEAIGRFCEAFAADDANLPAVRQLGALCARHPEFTDRVSAALAGARQPDVAQLLLQAALLQDGDNLSVIRLLREAYAKGLLNGYFPGEHFYLWITMLMESEMGAAEALPLLVEAAAVHPSSPEIKNCLAYLWAERSERLDDANRLINEALLAAPHNAAYLDTKGWVMFKRARPFGALQYLLKAAEIMSGDPVIFDHAGDVFATVGFTAEALRFWQKSHAILPTPDTAKKLAQ